MTALATLSGAWIGAAFLLWPSAGPELGTLRPDALFDTGTIARNGRYRDVLTALWALGVLGQLTGLAFLARRRPKLRGHTLVRAALLGGMAYTTLWIAQLPFRLAGHWWRRRYDVSDLGYLSHVSGAWSTTLGELVLSCVAGAAVVAISRRLGGRTWLGLWSVSVAIATAYVLVYPALLAPRLRPLQDRALAAEIQALATRAGLGETRVEVRRARERTRAVNAEAFGAGPTTSVILWDTLLEPHVGRGEIRFAAAHELEHVARQHPWRGLGWFILLALPGTWLVARLVRLEDPAGVPAAALALVCLQLVTLPLASELSRRYEAEADLEALRLTGDRASAEALFRRFVHTSLADPDPPHLLHTLLSTHPTVVERIATVRAAELPAAPGSP